MRIRCTDSDAAVALRAALEQVGGEMLDVGETYELVHPDGPVDPFTDVELRFFIRAVVGRRRDALEFLGS